MSYTTIFFDLDDTLYPPANGVWAAIRERMTAYMQEKLCLPREEIIVLRRHYYETYGTTLRGLQVHNQVDTDEFLAYVHDLPIHDMVRPDPGLRAFLQGLPLRKYIFTNADAAHAGRVLNALGVEDCFHGIIDVRALQFNCKPELLAYQMAMDLAGEKSAARCLYLDDAPRNLGPAYTLGMYTILVGNEPPHPAAYTSLQRPHDLRQAMPELWQMA